MIRKVIIKNFMSHKDTTIEFPEGITLLAGSSFSGKSAIMDAIYWVAYNRPTGDGYVSYWARDAKGKQSDDCLVTIEFDNHVVTRYRGKDGNRYILDGMTLDAIGTDVPDLVQKAINFAEVNSQSQMDPLFLISSSGGDIARLLNKTVKLDTIDVFLSAIDSRKRATKKAFETAESNIAVVDQELTKFSFLDKAKALIEKLEKLEAKNSILERDIEAIQKSITTYNSTYAYVKEIVKIIKSSAKIILQVDELLKKDNSNLIATLSKSILQYKQYVLQLSTDIDIGRAEKLVTKITRYLGIQKENEPLITVGRESVLRYLDIMLWIGEYPDQLKALQDQLPSVCPMCGKPLEGV